MTRLHRHQLRLIVITDARQASRRGGVVSVVRSALEAGAPAIQLRDKRRDARDILALAQDIRTLTREAGALFFLNDRADLALAVEADGVHLGPDDVPVSAVRKITPRGFLIGYSTDDSTEALKAVEEGADYVGCGTVWATDTKADAGEAIGLEGLSRVVRAVPAVPVVGIGGITPERAPLLAATGAAGVAVIGAVMAAQDPFHATQALLRATEGYV